MNTKLSENNTLIYDENIIFCTPLLLHAEVLLSNTENSKPFDLIDYFFV